MTGVKMMKPGDPDYENMLAAGNLACCSFCTIAERLSTVVGSAAILNGLINAYINVAHAYGTPKADVVETLCAFAAKMDDCYEKLDAFKAASGSSTGAGLADAEPQGRA